MGQSSLLPFPAASPLETRARLPSRVQALPLGGSLPSGPPRFAPELFKQVPDCVKEEGRVQGWRVAELPFQVHPGLNSGSSTQLPPAPTSQPSARKCKGTGRGRLLGRSQAWAPDGAGGVNYCYGPQQPPLFSLPPVIPNHDICWGHPGQEAGQSWASCLARQPPVLTSFPLWASACSSVKTPTFTLLG